MSQESLKPIIDCSYRTVCCDSHAFLYINSDFDTFCYFKQPSDHLSYSQIFPPLRLKVLSPSGLRLLRLLSPQTLRCFSGSFPRHERDGGHARGSSQVLAAVLLGPVKI